MALCLGNITGNISSDLRPIIMRSRISCLPTMTLRGAVSRYYGIPEREIPAEKTKENFSRLACGNA